MERGPRDIGSPTPDNAGNIGPLLFPSPRNPLLTTRRIEEVVLFSADPLPFEAGPGLETEEELKARIAALGGRIPTGGTGGAQSA